MLPRGGSPLRQCHLRGTDVMTEDERIRVTNTFEKRLACLWIEMLPGLMKDICGRERGEL